ncbi:MAG: FIST C-terminal domain-containing protein [Candidatus Omnitrophica bacterium]|nr:FIST C-terminal domain-containing protein [Candidatus Omnitrophota bacterium]MCM8793635.1 FIST C-terminal domain-containing protein [Candidatus Omnitrophota bacterium]
MNKKFIDSKELLFYDFIEKMSLKVGIGQSKNPVSFSAGKEAVKLALRDLKTDNPHLAFAFISATYDQEKAIEGIKSLLGETPLVGSSTAGEITPWGTTKHSLVVVVLKSDELMFSLGWGEGINHDSRGAGHKSALIANRKFLETLSPEEFRRKVFMIFPDGLTGNCADVLRGIQEILGRSFPIVGGSSGDDFLFQKTYQYCQKLILTGSIVGVLMGGNLSFGIGSRHGWKPLGKPRRVTKAIANIIYEIDHQPAVSLYEEYFGEEVMELKTEPLASMAILYPLGMVVPGEEEYLLRNPTTITEEGALVCGAEIPEGEEVRLMIGNKETLIEAASHAALTALKNLQGAKAKLVVTFSSISRNKLLGRYTDNEIDAVQEIFGKGVPIVGFYTYGEQAPLTSEINIGQTYFQNASFTLLAMGE